MLEIWYRGKRLIPSRTASRELIRYGFMLEDCVEILKNGYCTRKRKKNTIERWLDSGNKTFNVVVVLSYNHQFQDEVYLIKHFGVFTRKRNLKK